MGPILRVVHRPRLNPEVAYLVVGEELARHLAAQFFSALLGPIGSHGEDPNLPINISQDEILSRHISMEDSNSCSQSGE